MDFGLVNILINHPPLKEWNFFIKFLLSIYLIMKKLLFLFLLVSFTSLFSQESKITYLRAHQASMGVRPDENSPVTEWIFDGRGVPDGVYYGVVSIILNNEVVSYPFHVSIFHK